MSFAPLPGTAREITQIGELFDRAGGARITKLESSSASEARVKQWSGRARIVHLATHGYFAAKTLKPASLVGAEGGRMQVMSGEWKVDDDATQALMVRFYGNLLERKLGKLDALREAQLWLLNYPEAIEGRDLTTRGAPRPVRPLAEASSAPDESPRSHPFYWAAFQLSGAPN